MDDLALFDVPPEAFIEPVEPLTADRRRTQRQAEAIRLGGHPLGLLYPTVRMHPDADRDATAADGPGLPLRCGSCRYRTSTAGDHAGRYPKCLFGADGARTAPRFTNGPGTDVRAWWPACADYSATEAASAR